MLRTGWVVISVDGDWLLEMDRNHLLGAATATVSLELEYMKLASHITRTLGGYSIAHREQLREDIGGR